MPIPLHILGKRTFAAADVENALLSVRARIRRTRSVGPHEGSRDDAVPRPLPDFVHNQRSAEKERGEDGEMPARVEEGQERPMPDRLVIGECEVKLTGALLAVVPGLSNATAGSEAACVADSFGANERSP